MHECQLQYDDFSIQVTTVDEPLLVWLDEFLSPSFNSTSVGNPDWRITVVSAQDGQQGVPGLPAQSDLKQIDCFSRDGHFVRLPAWEEKSGVCTAFDDNCKCFYRVNRLEHLVEIVCDGDPQHARRALARVVRELATIHCLRRGDLPVHASAYAKDGKAFVLAGPRRVGKSTLLTSELLQGEAEFIANDRVMLQWKNGTLIARGMPTVIKLRPQTVGMFPQLAQQQAERQYHREFLTSEPQPHVAPVSAASSMKISRAQLCQLTGCKAVGARPLGTLLFPAISEQSRETQLQPLRLSEAYELIYGSLLLADSEYRLSALFCEAEADRIDSADMIQRCVNVIRSTNCHRLLVPRRAFESDRSNGRDSRAA